MPIFNNMLAGAAGQTTGGGVTPSAYQIDRSLRFNSGDSSYLSFQPSSAGNRRTWTWSGWVKRSAVSTSAFQNLFSANNSFPGIRFNNVDQLELFEYSGSYVWRALTNAVFRDPSAWYHICFLYDTTQATAADRIKLYVNNQIQTYSSISYPSQNRDGGINSNVEHTIGCSFNNATANEFFNGYLADVHFIDGQALAPTDFGQYDSNNVWQPKAYSGTYGTNGFKLDFSDNSSNAALGEDSSGNNNDWTVNNFLSSAVIQGYKGGDGYVYSGGNSGGGGGGGAGGAGYPGVSGVSAGDGGPGRQSSITGTATYYGGGGGGGSWGTAGGSGGDGGGGDGKLGGSSTGPANPGTDGLGGGGGGAGYASADWQAGGDGGSGRVIIRYASSHGALTAANSGSQTTVGSDYVYQWTTVGSGSITFPGSSAISVQYLVLGGGGGAENGGGGGGGVLEGTLSVTGGTSHTITVGDGGSGSVPYPNATAAANGNNSVFSTLTALGGGRGGGGDSNAAPTSGGSGGGAGSVSGATTGGAGTGDDPADLDSLVDSPTNGTQSDTGAGGEVVGNYATLNPLDKNGSGTLSNGNLEVSMPVGTANVICGTQQVTSGKWYWEASMTNTSKVMIGVSDGSQPVANRNFQNEGWYYFSENGRKYHDGINVTYGDTYDQDDIVGVALDMDAGTLTFYKNGVSQGVAYNTDLSGLSIVPSLGHASSGGTNNVVVNFGQRAFAYTAPSGYKALCTANFDPQPIADGSTAFDAKTYSGTGSSNSITGLNFSPDFVWIKRRNATSDHNLQDIIRGTSAPLYSNLTNAEGNFSQGLTAFNSDGFTVGTGGDVNNSSGTYVAWAWDGGTSTVSNTDGSITASVRANASAGFSIVTYTGNGLQGATVGHGLGVEPSMVIYKGRVGTLDWLVYHKALGATKGLYLNQAAAATTSSNFFNNTAPNSTTLYLNSSPPAGQTNQNTWGYVAYCFAPVAGYSAFGSYTGNNSADGPFVYTGFRPKWLLIKNSSNGGNWNLFDATRSTYNATGHLLLPNTNNAEYSQSPYNDFLSNGFKVRTTDSGKSGLNANQSGNTYIWAAFAEHPFKTARAR